MEAKKESLVGFVPMHVKKILQEVSTEFGDSAS